MLELFSWSLSLLIWKMGVLLTDAFSEECERLNEPGLGLVLREVEVRSMALWGGGVEGDEGWPWG